MMKIELGETLSKWLTILSGMLTLGASGFGSYWGNLFTYFASYVQKQFHVESELTAPWVLPLWYVGVASFNFFAGQLSKKIGKRATLFCGIVLQNFGLIMVYFVIDKSMFLINVCLGFVHGIGAGCVQITLTQFVLEWGGKRPGFFVALVRSFTMIGAIVINHFVTLYINPENLTPDTKIGSQRVFSQNSVLEKVPSTFLVLGGTFFCIEFICLLLVREKPRRNVLTTTIKSKSSCYHSVGSERTQLIESGSTRVKTDPHSSNDNIKDHSHEKSDLTPKQLLRRKEFYVLGLSMSCACVSFLNTNNYYKAYAQVSIHDDLFLTSVADVILGVKYFVALLWGNVFDKYGVKTGLVAFLTCISLSNVFFYFSPMLNKWVYSIAALFLVAFSTPLNLNYSICVAKAFGKQNFSSNFGMLTFFCIVVYLVSPLVLQVILEHSGWFYIFFLAASLSTVGLVSIILVLDESI